MNIHERPNVKTFCAWSRYRYYFFLYNTQAALLGHICAAHIRYDKKIARSCSEQYVLTPLSMHCTVLCCAQVQLIVTISEPRWAGDIGHLRRHFLLHKQSNGKISSRLKSLTFYGPIVSSPSSFCRISKQLQRRDGTRLDQDSHPNEKSAQPSHFVRRTPTYYSILS